MLIKRLLFCGVLFLAGCASQPGISDATAMPTPKGIGETVAQDLTSRYGDVRNNCGTTSQPVFLCNGILIRGTSLSKDTYNVWDNSDESHESGAVSFSYLRKDSRFDNLAYDYQDGYIFKPYFQAEGKVHPEVLCAFPIDASSENRQNRGCGPNRLIPSGASCQSQLITTGVGWHSHYLLHLSSHLAQCGFNVRDEIDDKGTRGFNAMINGMATIPLESFKTQNELRLEIWSDGIGERLPLQCFFYLMDSPYGLLSAQKNQKKFLDATGITVPIISLRLPRDMSDPATFRFIAQDQVIPVP